MKTKQDILALIEEEDVEFIRLQFTDMFGNLKNVAITANQLEWVLDHHYAFDATSLFGKSKTIESELYLRPDLDSFVILPWRPQQGKVARMICDICKEDGSAFEMSPRTILDRVITQTKEKGYTFMVDTDCEFFLFHTDENGVPTTVTHEQAGFMDIGPLDLGENARRDMVLSLEEMGFEIESSHHESASAQHEIEFRESAPMQSADDLTTFKSAVRSIARRFGLHATFMPKPKADRAGSGMRFNLSIYKDGKSILSADNSRELTQEGKWFIGGIMSHVNSICAVTNPLVNSYKRIISGFDAPKDIVWTDKNMVALVKVRKRNGENTKLELRFPDPSANPYLALALCIAAGMDGIEKQINPGTPAPACYEEGSEIASLPGTLREAIGYMTEDSFVETVLGKEFTSIYLREKTKEWNEYMTQVSDWEIEKYLYHI